MNPFTFVLNDAPLHNQLKGNYAALFVALNLAAELYSSGYVGSGDYRAYRYVINYFVTKFGPNHDFVLYLAAEFNRKAAL